jgi:signal transduction histidine kinase
LLPAGRVPPLRPVVGVADVVQRSIETVRGAHARTRMLRRFVVDTLALQADGVLVLDAARRVVLCNARAQSLLGLREEPRGLAAQQAFAGLADAQDRLSTLFEPPPHAIGLQQAEARNAAGSDLLVTATACPGDGTGLIGYIVNLTDVSALKAAAQAREEAMGFLSHDLRAPQASILAALELRRSDPASVSEAQLLEQVERSTRRTLALAEAFVTLTRADHLDPASFQPVDLADVCREVADEAWPLCRAKDVVCDTALDEAEAWVDGARSLLVAAVFNLLDNAIKYSPPGSRVQLSLRRHAGEWLLAVADAGPGIAPADVPRLFERFRRLGGEGRSAGPGAGLGLVIVDTVVRKHGGRIEVRSAPDSGAVFVVRLPVSAAGLDGSPDTDAGGTRAQVRSDAVGTGVAPRSPFGE